MSRSSKAFACNSHDFTKVVNLIYYSSKKKNCFLILFSVRTCVDAPSDSVQGNISISCVLRSTNIMYLIGNVLKQWFFFFFLAVVFILGLIFDARRC